MCEIYDTLTIQYEEPGTTISVLIEAPTVDLQRPGMLATLSQQQC